MRLSPLFFAGILALSPVYTGHQTYASSLQKELEALQNDVEEKTKRIEELKSRIAKENADSQKTKDNKVVDIYKIKTQSSIKIDKETSINIDKISKKNKIIFDRYDDRYYYIDADKNSSFITFNLSVTSKSKNPLLPSLYVGKLEGDSVVSIIPFDIRMYKWSSHGCLIGLYHDSVNDFAKKDTVRFVAATQIQNDSGTYVIFTDKKGMYERSEDKFSRPCITYLPKYAELSFKNLTKDEFVKSCILIKIIK